MTSLAHPLIEEIHYHYPLITVGKKKSTQNVCMHITSKQIELESHSWSGLVRFEFFTKPDQPGLTSLIRLEVVMERS